MSLAKRANGAHDLLVWMEELLLVFNYVLMDDFNTEYSYLTFSKNIYIYIYTIISKILLIVIFFFFLRER